MTRLHVFAVGIAIASIGTTESAARGESGQARAQDPAIRAALERQQPGPFHKKLSVWVGEWNTSWKVWHGPDQRPSDEATGKATFRSILGGRFVEGVYQGKGILGMAFEGRLILGFDAARREYTATWFNSFETASTSYAGNTDGIAVNAPLTGLSLRGQPSPHPKVAPVDSRVRFSFESGRILEEQFATLSTGQEFKAVEVVYTRGAR